MKFGIVAVGYNRPKSLKRLVDSLLVSIIENYSVDLIISIDKSNKQDEVLNILNGVHWSHGDLKIIKQPLKLGLREHILKCGDFTTEYDAVIVLEDDLIVSPYFFNYVRVTVERYADDNRIGGISLYKHETHPGVFRPFVPENNGYDVFFMQFAQSWGQCWTSKMWADFRKWYDHNKNEDLGRDSLLPTYITQWNSQSWLKFYMRYLVESNKYFVYPYVSLSTNASDIGEHNVASNNDFQVPFLLGSKEYYLPSFEKAIKYDVFFERQGIEDQIFTDLKGKKIIDLYGIKRDFSNANYLISTQALPYKAETSFQIKYRPHEKNCIYVEEGKDAFVYNLSKKNDLPKISINRKTRYDVRAIYWKRLIKLGCYEFYDALKLKIKRKKKK